MHDYLHPTTTGMEQLVYGMLDNVVGNTFTFSRKTSVSGTANAAISGSFEVTPSLSLIQNDGIIQFLSDEQIRMTCSTNINTSWTKLFDIDPLPCIPNKILGVAEAALVEGGNTVNVLLAWTVLNGGFYIRANGAHNSVTRILLTPLSSCSMT